MDIEKLYPEHVAAVARDTEKALAAARDAGATFDGILFHAGSQAYYHADDHHIAFKPTPHFARWAPVAGPDHVLHFEPGKKPVLVRVIPEDYWYEPPAEVEHPYPNVLDVVDVPTAAAAKAHLGSLARCAFIGGDTAAAKAYGIAAKAVEPKALLAQLDWFRAYKTPYEVACIREAGRIAAVGHSVVRQGVAQRLSERALHAAYLDATGMLETDCPYTNIIAWDDRSAILHYQSKRVGRPNPGACLLIDAGAAHYGYASDITRTYVRDNIHPVFRQALDRMEVMQLELVEKVGPGASYEHLQDEAHRGVAEILCDLGLLNSDAPEAFERGLTQPFFPHGLGHHLGLQVHDIGGKQVTASGEQRRSPKQHPFLRTTRPLEAGHVVTVEPGLYFIPMLLEPFRASRDADTFAWDLIDALIPCGGIRVEDDVVVTASGRENLTRPFVE
jgi:Xaa-Pro dipeptidase